MSANLEGPETTGASNIDRGSSIHKISFANTMSANYQDQYFGMQNPSSQNHTRNPRPANMTKSEDRSRNVEGTGNNGEVQVGFEEEEEEEGDEIDEQDEPGVVGEFGEEEAEGEDD
jgi:hypothetical protein